MADLFYGKGITVASGFDLGAKSPLDHRTIVETIADRDAHVAGNRAYEGMVVFVKENQTSYQYVKITEAETETFKWKVFGADAVDLSDYATKTYVTEEIAKAVTSGTIDLSAYATIESMNAELAKKIDAVEGSRLMTDEEGTKLAGLKNYDDAAVKADIARVEGLIPDVSDLASTTYVDGKVAGLVDSAPEALDTLKELATALGDDPNFATTVATQIGTKADKKHTHAEYATTEAMNAALADKASATHTHSEYLTQVPAEYVTDDELTAKGFLIADDISALATKEEVNAGLAGKAETSHTHTVAEITDFPEIPSIDGLATTQYVDAGDTYTTDMLIVSNLGGIKAGEDLNNMTVKQILTKLLYPYVAPVISASSTPNGGIFEKGNAQSVTNIKAVVTKKSEAITKIEVFDGASSLGVNESEAIAKGGTFDFPVTVQVDTNKSFTAKATDASGKIVSANTGSFTFVYPYYVGVCAEDAVIDEALVKGLTKKVETKATKTIGFDCDNQKMVFAYPKAYGDLRSIMDPNNFDVTGTFTKSEINITGLDGTAQTYNVYVNGASTVSNFNMKFNI